MNVESFKKEFVPQYLSVGNDKFYRSILFVALQKLVLISNETYRGVFPHLEYLNYYEQFIILYRREGDQVYIDIAKMFRKAAHRIYRIMRKKNMATLDVRFLNSV